MERQLRFARTPDGMNLAHFNVGDGLPFLKMPAPDRQLLELTAHPHTRRYSTWTGRNG